MGKTLEFLKNVSGYLLTGAKAAVDAGSLIPNLFSEAVGEGVERTLGALKNKYAEHRLYQAASEKLEELSAKYGEAILDGIQRDILSLKGKSPEKKPKSGKAYAELLLTDINALTPEALERFPSFSLLSPSDKATALGALLDLRAWLSSVCLEAMENKDRIFVNVLAERMKNEFHGELEAFKSELKLAFYGKFYKKLDECPVCRTPASGGENDLEAGEYRCGGCGRVVSLGEKTDLSGALGICLSDSVSLISSAVSREVKQLLSEQDEKKLDIALTNLRRELAPLHPNPEQVKAAVCAVLAVDPTNALAEFFRLMYTGCEEDYCAYLISGDFSNAELKDRITVANKAIDYLRSGNQAAAVSAYMKRTLPEGETSAALFEKLYREVEKLDSDQYDPTLPRDLFIIYKHEDLSTVRRLVADIEAEDDYTCFYSERNLQNLFREGDKTYWEKIFEAMNACRAILFVSTELSRTNEGYHLKEMREWIALEQRAIAAAHPKYAKTDYEFIPKEFKKPRYEYFVGVQDGGAKPKRTVSLFFDGYNHGGTNNLESVFKFLDSVRRERASTPAPTDLPRPSLFKAASAAPSAIAPVRTAPKKAAKPIPQTDADAAKYASLIEKARKQGFSIDPNLVLLRYTGGKKNLRVPKFVRGIGNNAFAHNSRVRSVTIPEGVTFIGQSAFAHCNYLTKLSLPKSLVSIESRAFECCFELTSISLPDGITRIEDFTFLSCVRLSGLKLPEGLTHIGKSAFEKCESIAVIMLPEAVKYVGENAFLDMNKLSVLTLPDGLEYVGDNFIHRCNSLTYTLFEDCKYLGNSTNPYAVLAKSTNKLCQVRIHKDTKHLCSGAFLGQTKLTGIRLPDGLRTVGAGAFNGCTQLAEVDFGNSLTRISDFAFANTSLGEISLPDTVKEIGERAFSNNRLLRSVKLGKGVRRIGEEAFSGCGLLEELHIPSSCTVANNAFKGRIVRD